MKDARDIIRNTFTDVYSSETPNYHLDKALKEMQFMSKEQLLAAVEARFMVLFRKEIIQID
jgi:hypothetical protein